MRSECRNPKIRVNSCWRFAGGVFWIQKYPIIIHCAPGALLSTYLPNKGLVKIDVFSYAPLFEDLYLKVNFKTW